MLGVALDRHDVDGLGVLGVHVDHEAEVGREVPAHLPPGVAAVVAAHDVPVLLHVQHVGPGRVGGDVVDAVAHLGVGVGDPLRVEAPVDRPPRAAGVVAAEGPGGGDGGDDAVGAITVEDDRVEAHAPRPRLPGRARSRACAARPARPTSGRRRRRRTGRVLDPGVDLVGVGG